MADHLAVLAAALLNELNAYERFGFIYQAMEDLLERFLNDPELEAEPEVRGLQEALEAFDGVRIWLSTEGDAPRPHGQRWGQDRWIPPTDDPLLSPSRGGGNNAP